MLKGPLLFITGAGASVDSGLETYRGTNGIYNNGSRPEENLSLNTWAEDPRTTWETLSGLIQSIKDNNPGETYEILKQINNMYDMTIYTQNIDGYSHYACDNVHELHGDINQMICKKCEIVYNMNHEHPICGICTSYCKPSIVLYGEPINKIPAHLKNNYNTVIIVGTTLQFKYLKDIIKKYKSKGARIIHINPDPDYHNLVKKNEDWFQMKSADGLKTLFMLSGNRTRDPRLEI